MKTKPKNSIKERAKKVPPEIKMFVKMQYDLIKEIDEEIAHVKFYYDLSSDSVVKGLLRAKKIIQNYKPNFKKIRK